MADLLRSPHLIDLVLVFTLLEAGVLITWRKDIVATLTMIAPGLCLMLALRAAMADAAWPFVPMALAAALVTHLLDLRHRWGR